MPRSEGGGREERKGRKGREEAGPAPTPASDVEPVLPQPRLRVDRSAAARTYFQVEVRAGALPVAPTRPMTSPAATLPEARTIDERWQNHSSVPSSVVRTMR
ncbi:hypothetical protein SRIMM317S_05265 [Streptomyces rimosus subsp. rimosus]